MLYLLSALSVMYILLMYYISLLLLPPDGFVLCYIGLLVLTLWRFDDDVISPSPGTGRYTNPQLLTGLKYHIRYRLWRTCHVFDPEHGGFAKNRLGLSLILPLYPLKAFGCSCDEGVTNIGLMLT